MLFRFTFFLVILFIAIILWRYRQQSLFVRWMSACMFIVSSQPLSACVSNYFLPYLHAGSVHGYLIVISHIFLLASAFIFVFYFPLSALMGGIAYSGFLSRKTNLILCCFTFIGVSIFAFSYPSYPVLDYDFKWIHYYASGCMVLGILFIAISCMKERDFFLRLHRIRTLFVYGVTMLWLLFVMYLNIGKIYIDDNGETRVPAWLSTTKFSDVFFLCGYFTILIFIYFAVKYGMFGIKLRIEQQRLESSMTALTTGTSIINHAIKNELSKIDYLRNRIKDQLRTNNLEKINEFIDRMPQMSQHLQHMMNHIHEKTGEIILNESKQSLFSTIASVIQQLEALLEQRQIQLFQQLQCDVTLICDPFHLREALVNLCLNAIDAMDPGKGILIIRSHVTRSGVTIEIQDNGHGIPRELLSKVFNPFYTTKNTKNNYGLGLSYCYSVARKHSGTLKIVRSDLNRGTTVALMIPQRRIVKERSS